MNWNQVVATGCVVAVGITVAFLIGRMGPGAERPLTPSPLASVVAEIKAQAKHESDVVDTRTAEWAKFKVENAAWIDEREADVAMCDKRNGVPVFTYGMRMFCVSRSVIIGDEMPKRIAPEMAPLVP